MPECIASLPLTKLCLNSFNFPTDTLQQRYAGGFSREFTQLAPTLQVRWMTLVPGPVAWNSVADMQSPLPIDSAACGLHTVRK